MLPCSWLRAWILQAGRHGAAVRTPLGRRAPPQGFFGQNMIPSQHPYGITMPLDVVAFWAADFSGAKSRVGAFAVWYGYQRTDRKRRATLPIAAQLKGLRAVHGGKITYERQGRTWIVVSGFLGNRIFYRKAMLACGGATWHYMEFEYPAAQKRAFDELVTQSSAALGLREKWLRRLMHSASWRSKASNAS
jgi:hypothetical protein